MTVKVLLADPDPVTATMYELGLEHSGFDVERVHNASELFEAAGHGERAIVMEWEKLGLGGPEVLEHLRSEGALEDVPVLVLTNQDGDLEHLTQEAVEAGADRWLVKVNTTPAALAENVLDVLSEAA